MGSASPQKPPSPAWRQVLPPEVGANTETLLPSQRGAEPLLKFRLGAVPVSVHFSFLFLALLGPVSILDSRSGRTGGETIAFTVAWLLGVFLAILAHEAGHAFTARSFGARNVSIVLYAFGGATTYPLTRTMTPGRRFLISAAGSAVGIVTGAALLAAGTALGWWDPQVGLFDFIVFRRQTDVVLLLAWSYVFAALIWGILNWLPIRPLDGGHMLESFLEMVAPSIAETGTKVISLAVGVPVIIFALSSGNWFAAAIVGFLLMSGLRSRPATPTDQSVPDQSESGQTTLPQTPASPSAPGVEEDEQPHLRSGRQRRRGTVRPPSDDPPDFPI